MLLGLLLDVMVLWLLLPLLLRAPDLELWRTIQ